MSSLGGPDEKWRAEKTLEYRLTRLGATVRAVDLSALLAARRDADLSNWIDDLKRSALQQRRVNIVRVPLEIFTLLSRDDESILFASGLWRTRDVYDRLTGAPKSSRKALLVISDDFTLTDSIHSAHVVDYDSHGRLRYPSRQVGPTLASYLGRKFGVTTDSFNTTHLLMAEKPSEDEIELAEGVGARAASLIAEEGAHGVIVAARAADKEIVTAPLGDLVNMPVPVEREGALRKPAPAVLDSASVWFPKPGTGEHPVAAVSPIVPLPDEGGEKAFELKIVMKREMHTAPSSHVFKLVKAHAGVRLRIAAGPDREEQDINGVMDLLFMALDRGTEVRWIATGPKAREVLNQIWLWNEQEWPNAVPAEGTVPTFFLRGGTTEDVAKEIVAFMEVGEADMVSGIYDIETGRITIGYSRYYHETIARAAGLGEAWDRGHITRIVFARSTSTLTAHFPHLRIQDSDVGKVALQQRFAPFFEGIRFSIDGGAISIRAGALTRRPRPSGSIPSVVATEYPPYERLDPTGNRREMIDIALSDLTRNVETTVERDSFKSLSKNERVELYLRLAAVLDEKSKVSARPAVIVLQALSADLPFRERFELLRRVDVVFRDTGFKAKQESRGLIEQFTRDFFQARFDYSLYISGEQIRDQTIVINACTLFYGDRKGRDSTKLAVRPGTEAWLEGLSRNNKLILYSPHPNRDILRMFAKHPVLKRVFTGYRASEPKGRFGLHHSRGVITLQDHVRAMRRFLKKVEVHPLKLTTAEKDYWEYLRKNPDRAISELHPVMVHQMGIVANSTIDSAESADESPAVSGTRVFEMPVEGKATGLVWDLASAMKQEGEGAASCVIGKTRLPIGYPIGREKVLIHFGIADKIHEGVNRALAHRVREVDADARRRERKTQQPIPEARALARDPSQGGVLEGLPLPPIKRTEGTGGGEGGTTALSTGAEIFMLGNTALDVAAQRVIASPLLADEAIQLIDTSQPTRLLRHRLEPVPRNDRIMAVLFARAIAMVEGSKEPKTRTVLLRLREKAMEDPSAIATLLAPDRLEGFLRRKGHEEVARRLSEAGGRLSSHERLVIIASVVSGEANKVFERLSLSPAQLPAPGIPAGVFTGGVDFQSGAGVLNILR